VVGGRLRGGAIKIGTRAFKKTKESSGASSTSEGVRGKWRYCNISKWGNPGEEKRARLQHPECKEGSFSVDGAALSSEDPNER